MRKSFSRAVCSAIFVIPFFCLFFVSGCGYKYIKGFEGADLPANQIAKFYLEDNYKSALTTFAPSWPLYLLVDGKLYERKRGRAKCVVMLPGEHEVTIIPKSQHLSDTTVNSAVYVNIVTSTSWTISPDVEKLIIKFNAEKAREYLLVTNNKDNSWYYCIFWIEDKISKKRITEEFHIEWKSR